MARAGGNPLYAEQYARMLRERTTGELTLPENVQGIIAARLDWLEPEQKALLQDASVRGKTSGWGSRAPSPGSSAIRRGKPHSLERKGSVRRKREASILGDTEYGFSMCSRGTWPTVRSRVLPVQRSIGWWRSGSRVWGDSGSR